MKTSKWYRITRYSIEIVPVEVERSSEHFIWRRGQSGNVFRTKIKSAWDQFFAGRAEAVESIRKRLVGAVDYAERELKDAKENLQQFCAKEGP